MKKLAVIDDEIDFCVLVKMYSNKLNIECRYANTLADGIKLLKEFSPDVLILDNNLPDGSGWQKATSISQQYPSLQLHLITAKSAILAYEKPAPSQRLIFHHKPLSLTDIEKIISKQ